MNTVAHSMEEGHTADEFAPYIAGLVRRERARRRRMRQRATQALEAARAAADLLRRRYGATRVRLFGSVLHPERFHERSDVDLAVEVGQAPTTRAQDRKFHERSDVDLAVEGLAPQDYLSAWAVELLEKGSQSNGSNLH